MRTLIPLCLLVASLLSGCATQRDALNNRSGPGHLVGAWRLVSWTSTADGQTNHPYGPNAHGLLLYTPTGRMSVFLSQANRSAFARAEAGTTEEKAAAFDSCFGYSGSFEVDAGRVIHRLEQCTFPNWIGTEQVRFVRFELDCLILETPPLPTGGRNAVSRLIWRKLNP